jgi:hypothetical protein
MTAAAVEQGLLAITREPGIAGLRPAAERIQCASDLNSVVRFQGRQLRYLDGNACTEYEDESDV